MTITKAENRSRQRASADVETELADKRARRATLLREADVLGESIERERRTYHVAVAEQSLTAEQEAEVNVRIAGLDEQSRARRGAAAVLDGVIADLEREREAAQGLEAQAKREECVARVLDTLGELVAEVRRQRETLDSRFEAFHAAARDAEIGFTFLSSPAGITAAVTSADQRVKTAVERAGDVLGAVYLMRGVRT